MIKLYGYPQTRSTRAAWALEEAGAEYTIVPINLRAGEHKTAEYLRLNPFGKIPTLVDGDLVLTESAAICTYIAEKFPEAGLIPTESNARAQYFQWMFFAVSELEAHLWLVAKHNRILPEEARIPSLIPPSIAAFQDASNIMANHLNQHTYLAGNQFTAADIICVSVLNWAYAMRLELNPVLGEYRARICERPAFARARQREADSIGQQA